MSPVLPNGVEGDAPFHEAFGLTYASYLVLPRSVLEAMPHDWQRQVIALLDRLPEAARRGDYWVRRRDAEGRFIHDPLSEYRHPDREMLAELIGGG